MTKIRLDYVHEFEDRHGKVRRYVRLHGKRTPLPGLPGSAEFMAAYEAAIAGIAPRADVGSARTRPGSINAAIVSYYRSTSFLSLARGTQSARRHLLEQFRAAHGDKRVATLGRGHVETMVAAKATTPFGARNFLKALRGLMEHAVTMEMRTDDPTVGVKRPKVQSAGIHTWIEGEIAQFEQRHPIGSRARLALGLAVYTGQRRGDLIRLGKQHIWDGAFHITQRKTGSPLVIPVHPDLATIIAATPSDHLTFLTTHTGAPFTDAGIGNIFKDWCREAGLPEVCSLHGLRKAACRRLAEAGASANVIASISGHKSLREVERYTRAADQARMARAGMAMIGSPQTEKRTSSGKPE